MFGRAGDPRPARRPWRREERSETGCGDWRDWRDLKVQAVKMIIITGGRPR